MKWWIQNTQLSGASALSVLLLLLSSSAVQKRGVAAQAPSPQSLTFRDIAPIIDKHCVPCHRPGGAAPFSLLRFDAVKSRARLIAEVVGRRLMPPWLPESDDFADSRRLSESEVLQVQKWVDGGAQEGALADTVMLREPEIWEFGQPDVVVAMPAAFALPGEGSDRFRTFVVPLPITERRFVRAWELWAEGLNVLHHATLLVDSTKASRERDAEDPLPGYEGLIPFSARNPEGFFLGWTPGQRAQRAPQGMAWAVGPGTDLVVMAHLVPSGRVQNVQISIGLYFADEMPQRRPVMVTLTKQDIDIPPGEPRYVATDSFTLPVDVDVLSLQPHAHRLARRMLATATRPDGETRRLLEIRNWNFRWQEVYRFATPIPLPAGTRLSMEYIYDNSADNPQNPHVPPRRVTYGQLTANEMGDLSIQVVPRRQQDLTTLNRSAEAAMLPKTIRGYEMMVTNDPDNASLHDDLALLYLRQGESAKSAEQFRESLRIKPKSPQAHYNVGMALLRLQNDAAAKMRFRESVLLDPSYGNGHYGLAVVLQREGSLSDAMAEAREAVRLLPADGEVSAALASIQYQACDERAASAEYRRALALDPSSPVALAGLASLLATSADPAILNPTEARVLIQKAVSFGGLAETTTLNIMAAVSAADGRFDEAVAFSDQALTHTNSEAEAQVVRSRRELFVRKSRLTSGCSN